MGRTRPAASAAAVARAAAILGRAVVAGAVPRRLPTEGPLVTVVIATYNWSSVLRHAIASVELQRYSSWELLVVGDGCSDDSQQAVEEVAACDQRVRWLGLPQNSGSQSAPNNAGIAAARGDYIAYLGHDDIWLPDHLARLVACARRRRVPLAVALAAQIGPPGSSILHVGPLRAWSPGQSLVPSSLLHERALAERSGGWRDFRELVQPPDTEFAQRLMQEAGGWAQSPALTVLKFNSALRPRSYIERPSHEQAAALAAVRTRPRRTVLALLLRVVALRLRRPRQRVSVAAAPAPPLEPVLGRQVHEWRRIRGLPSLEEPAHDTGDTLDTPC